MKQKKQLPELKPAEFVIFSPDCFTTNNSFSLYTVPCYFQRDGFIWLSIHLGYKFNLSLIVPSMANWSYTTLISHFAKPKQALPSSTIVAYQTYHYMQHFKMYCSISKECDHWEAEDQNYTARIISLCTISCVFFTLSWNTKWMLQNIDEPSKMLKY